MPHNLNKRKRLHQEAIRRHKSGPNAADPVTGGTRAPSPGGALKRPVYRGGTINKRNKWETISKREIHRKRRKPTPGPVYS